MTRLNAVTLLMLTGCLLACLPFDHAVALWARDLPEPVHHAARLMAIAGRSVWILAPLGALAALLLLARRRWPRGVPVARFCAFVFAAVALSGLAADAIKPFFGRPRPYQWLKDPAATPQPFSFRAAFESFPSGHADTAVALALALGVHFPRARWPLLGWAALMACSRVAMNAHYPSDVFGGALVGAAVTLNLTAYAARRGWINPALRDRGLS